MEVFKSCELKRLREDLDDLEVESQNFSKLVNDARRRFKDFLMTVDRINPLFIEMYIRNSWKSHQRWREGSSSTTTPYRRLRQDSFNSSEESLTERVRTRSLSRYFLSRKDERKETGEKCDKVLWANEGAPYSDHRHAQLSTIRATPTFHGKKLHCTDSSETDSGKFTASVLVERYDHGCQREENGNRSSEKAKFTETGSEAHGLSGSNVHVKSSLLTRDKEFICDFTEQNCMWKPDQEHSTIESRSDVALAGMMNAELMQCNYDEGSFELDSISRELNNNDITEKTSQKAMCKKYILDCSMSEDNIESPLVPQKLSKYHHHLNSKSNFHEAEEKDKDKACGKDCNTLVTSDAKLFRRREHSKVRQQNSEPSNMAYTKDQRKRLKKKMKNAFKKPENCCFMGQV